MIIIIIYVIMIVIIYFISSLLFCPLHRLSGNVYCLWHFNHIILIIFCQLLIVYLHIVINILMEKNNNIND